MRMKTHKGKGKGRKGKHGEGNRSRVADQHEEPWQAHSEAQMANDTVAGDPENPTLTIDDRDLRQQQVPFGEKERHAEGSNSTQEGKTLRCPAGDAGQWSPRVQTSSAALGLNRGTFPFRSRHAGQTVPNVEGAMLSSNPGGGGLATNCW